MKKKKLKGFTLIECIVALAIIGIASLLMAQIYSSIALINRNNAKLNQTLSDQMKQAENEVIEKTGDVNVLVVSNYDKDQTLEVYKTDSTAIGSGNFSKDGSGNYDMEFKAVDGFSKSKFTLYPDEINIDVVIYKSTDTAIASGKDATIRYMFIRPGAYQKKD